MRVRVENFHVLANLNVCAIMRKYSRSCNEHVHNFRSCSTRVKSTYEILNRVAIYFVSGPLFVFRCCHYSRFRCFRFSSRIRNSGRASACAAVTRLHKKSSITKNCTKVQSLAFNISFLWTPKNLKISIRVLEYINSIILENLVQIPSFYPSNKLITNAKSQKMEKSHLHQFWQPIRQNDPHDL